MQCAGQSHGCCRLVRKKNEIFAVISTDLIHIYTMYTISGDMRKSGSSSGYDEMNVTA